MPLLIGIVGLAIGLALVVAYFSLAKFFDANARPLERKGKAPEKTPLSAHSAQPQQAIEKLDQLKNLQRSRIKTAAKAGT